MEKIHKIIIAIIIFSLISAALIYSFSSKTQDTQTITELHEDISEVFAKFNHDSTKIVWVEITRDSEANSHSYLYISDIDGKNKIQLLDQDGSIYNFHFSNDDNKIIYTYGITTYQMNLDGSNVEIILDEGYNTVYIDEAHAIIYFYDDGPFNSSNGIIDEHHYNYFYVDLITNQTKRITSYYDDWHAYITDVNIVEKKILFELNYQYPYDYGDSNDLSSDFIPGIYEMNFNGTGLRLLIGSNQSDLYTLTNAKYSPDYQYILFVNGSQYYQDQIYLLNRNNLTYTKISNLQHPEYFTIRADFLDNNQIMYVGTDAPPGLEWHVTKYQTIFILDLEGNILKTVNENSDWNVKSISPDGKYFAYTTEFDEGKLCVYEI